MKEQEERKKFRVKKIKYLKVPMCEGFGFPQKMKKQICIVERVYGGKIHTNGGQIMLKYRLHLFMKIWV